VAVDEDRMLDIIDQMRIAIPEEVKKAQQLLSQRDRVMAQAQEEANRTLDIAREKADGLVKKDGIVQEAERRAEQILGQARADAEATRHEADDYVIDTLGRLQDELNRSINQVNNGIRALEDERMRRAAPASSPPASIPTESKSEEK
jgi:F0F1-type ATP synthase membrane subunit b/b'